MLNKHKGIISRTRNSLNIVLLTVNLMRKKQQLWKNWIVEKATELNQVICFKGILTSD